MDGRKAERCLKGEWKRLNGGRKTEWLEEEMNMAWVQRVKEKKKERKCKFMEGGM